MALRLLEAATRPRTTVQSPQRWSASGEWKMDYCNPDRVPSAEWARLRVEFDAAKEEAKGVVWAVTR
jgi:D-proline reductase (dithiol) PrdB